MLAPALQKLIDGARLERGRLALDAPEREFYLGVDAAAQGVLHPQTLAARPEDWLERESRAFADGYLTTMADIAIVVTRNDA